MTRARRDDHDSDDDETPPTQREELPPPAAAITGLRWVYSPGEVRLQYTTDGQAWAIVPYYRHDDPILEPTAGEGEV